MKQAVCALIMRGDHVLCVSRKNDPNDFGLPGGKVDEGESLVDALVREIKEETGLWVAPARKVFEQIDGEYIVSTFHCFFSGDVNTTEAGVVKWLTWDELTTQGTFREYNLALLNQLNRDA